MHMNKKLKILCQLMSLGCIATMMVLTITTLWFWSDFKANASTMEIARFGVLQLDTIKSWQIVSAAIFSILNTAVMIYGLEQLRQLFKYFKAGAFFTQMSVKLIHRFCMVLFICSILKIVSTIFYSLVLTWSNGPNQKALVIQFGSNEFWLLFVAFTFLTIAWCFREGHRLTQENAEFV